MNMNKVINLWKEEKQKFVKESTMSVYMLIIEKHLKVFLNQNEITEQKIQHLVFEKLDAGLSEKTVRDIIIVLKMILKYAFKNKFIEYFEVDIKIPRLNQKKKIRTLTKMDQKKMTEYIMNNFSFKNFGILLTLHTGLRIGEICALKWSDINMKHELVIVNKTIQRIYDFNSDSNKTKIIINTPKTIDSTREIPLSNQLIKILKPLKEIVREDNYVIKNEKSIMEPRVYRKHLVQLCEKLEIDIINFHALRHTFATRCIESKADYKTVSSLLGHSNIGTTLNLYVHPDNNQKKNTIEEMLKCI